MSKRSPSLSFTCSSVAYLFIVILVVVCGAARGSAQTATPTPTPLDLQKTADFHDLFSERELLIETVNRLELIISELAERQRGLPPLSDLEEELTRLKGELDKERNGANDESKVGAIQGYINDTIKKIEIQKNAPELTKTKHEAYLSRRRLTQVEQKIASLFDDKRDESWFRAISTIAVGLLIAVVVGGFYLIAWKKDGIAAKIFGGEMGMQFVTLFLIVIAIILFGIMGTLEGRELAALLGGLSGYILGKASVKVDASRNDANPGSQDQQRQNEQQQEQQQNQDQQNQNPG